MESGAEPQQPQTSPNTGVELGIRTPHGKKDHARAGSLLIYPSLDGNSRRLLAVQWATGGTHCLENDAAATMRLKAENEALKVETESLGIKRGQLVKKNPNKAFFTAWKFKQSAIQHEDVTRQKGEKDAAKDARAATTSSPNASEVPPGDSIQ